MDLYGGIQVMLVYFDYTQGSDDYKKTIGADLSQVVVLMFMNGQRVQYLLMSMTH